MRQLFQHFSDTQCTDAAPKRSPLRLLEGGWVKFLGLFDIDRADRKIFARAERKFQFHIVTQGNSDLLFDTKVQSAGCRFRSDCKNNQV